MKYKCLIFDLDGTLIDSLKGILGAVNLTFSELGYDIKRSYEQGRHYIGAGAITFAKRAIEGLNLNQEQEDEFIKIFLKNYGILQKEVTKPFAEIIDLLKYLKVKGYKVCIATNKPHDLLLPLIDDIFAGVDLDYAIGQKPGAPAKPNPHVIYEIFKNLNVEANDCCYIGDSQYDLETAVNSGIDSIIVKYGYGFYDKPWITKATYTVNTVKELKNLLD